MYRNIPLKEKNATRKSIWLWICWDGADFWKEEVIRHTIDETM